MLAFQVGADATIALAYFSIPIFLIWLVRKRGDLPFSWIFGLFALFIVSCGMTHLMSIWVIWHPDYWAEGTVKWVTAASSMGTALLLIPLGPKLLKIRTPEQSALLMAQLDRERAIATSFQSASISSLPHDPPGFAIDAIYRPAEGDLEIGGDWYDAFLLLDGRLLVSIGDVAGKGLAASVVMSKVRQAIRVAGQTLLHPAAILNAADRALRSEYPDTIVTALVGIFDLPERAFTFATAGHPGPIVRHPSGRVEALDGSSLPLGLRLREESTSTRRVDMEAGSLYVLYTDGLIEATRDIGAAERQLHAVVAELARAAPRPAEAIHDLVVGQSARDDIAILTIGITTLAPDADAPRWTFDARDAVAASAIRCAVRALLQSRGLSVSQCSDAEEIYAELIGNVVRHAPGPVDVWVDWNRGSPVLHVVDEGPGFEYVPKLPQDIYSESGRGLYLVSVLAEQFDVVRRAEKGSHARAVLAAGPDTVSSPR